MNLKMFTVRDSKAEAYLTPFFLPNRGMAARVFGDCVGDRNHQFARHPEDHSLFELGDFDDVTGAIVLHPEPVFLHKAIEFQTVVGNIPINEPALPLEMQPEKARGRGRPPKDA
jgi:hypothetical protein